MGQAALNLRTRRFVAMVGVVAFLAAYVWGVIAVGERLPQHPLVHLLFYGIAGLAWGAPLIPMLRWAEGGKAQPVSRSRKPGAR